MTPQEALQPISKGGRWYDFNQWLLSHIQSKKWTGTIILHVHQGGLNAVELPEPARKGKERA